MTGGGQEDSGACWVMGTERRWHSHTPQSGYSPVLMSLAGAVSGSCGARTNSGRGHGKWGDVSAELCYHWLSDWRVGLCMYVCVCLSVGLTDWWTVDPRAVCMICPILCPATLCKQQLSGPTESHWQEVSTGVYEQDSGKEFIKELELNGFLKIRTISSTYKEITFLS